MFVNWPTHVGCLLRAMLNWHDHAKALQLDPATRYVDNHRLLHIQFFMIIFPRKCLSGLPIRQRCKVGKGKVVGRKPSASSCREHVRLADRHQAHSPPTIAVTAAFALLRLPSDTWHCHSHHLVIKETCYSRKWSYYMHYKV